MNGLCWHRQTDLFLLELQHFALSPLFSFDLLLPCLEPQKVFGFDTLEEPKMQWTDLLSFVVLQELPESDSEVLPLLQVLFCEHLVQYLSLVELVAFYGRCCSNDLRSLERE